MKIRYKIIILLLAFFGIVACCNICQAAKFKVERPIYNSYGEWMNALAENPEYNWSDDGNGIYNNFCNDAKKLYIVNWSGPLNSGLPKFVYDNSKLFYNVEDEATPIMNNYAREELGGGTSSGLGSSLEIEGHELGAGGGYDEPGVGYARWLITKLHLYDEMIGSIDTDAHKSIQLLTWISKLWGEFYEEDENTSLVQNPIWTYGMLDNYSIARRGKEYAEFWYGIYSKLRDPEQPFKCLSKEDDIHIYVDQAAGTITAGPYFLKLDTVKDTYVEDERNFYNELSKKTLENYPDLALNEDLLYAKFLSIDNIAADGKPWFVNKNGKKINFPNFVDREPFYIRFKPANDGYISEINLKNKIPEIKCQYYDMFSGSKSEYETKEFGFEYLTTTGKIVLDQKTPERPVNTYIMDPTVKYPETIQFSPDTEAKFEISATKLRWYLFTMRLFGADIIYYPSTTTGELNAQPNTAVADHVVRYLSGGYKWKEPSIPARHLRYTYVYREDEFPKDSPDYENGYKAGDEYDSGEEYTPYALKDRGKYADHVSRIILSGNSHDCDTVWENDFNWPEDEIIEDLYENQLSEWEWDEDVFVEWEGKYGGGYSLDIDPIVINEEKIASGEYEGEGLRHIINSIQSRVIIGNPGTRIQKTKTELVKKGINMQIQGTVWMDGPSIKGGSPNGTFDGVDNAVGGVEVRLYRSDNNELAATTITDASGKYWFFGKRADTEPLINPMYKYYVEFIYNGQLYIQTDYADDISSPGGHSNAKEDGGERAGLNARFSTINATPNNYNGSSEAFAYHAQIRDKSGNQQGMTYAQVWAEFLQNGANLVGTVKDPQYTDYDVMWKGGEFDHNYDEVYAQVNAGAATGDVVNYIKDCMISAKSEIGHAYPQYEQFMIESVDTENSRFQGTMLVPNYSNLSASDYESKTISVPGNSDKEKRLIQYEERYEELIKNIVDGKMEGESYKTVEVMPDGTKVIRTIKPEAQDKITYDEVDFDFEQLDVKYYHLYSMKSAQCFWVDFGMKERIITDLALQKDLYKVRIIFNGKEEIYKYSDKASPEIQLFDDNSRMSLTGDTYQRWDYGGMKYQRKVRASDYLYRAQDYGEPEIKNMQVYATYRIAVKNQGGTNVTLNEVVDYYDADMYTFDGDGYTPKQHTSNLRPGSFVQSYIVHDSGGYDRDEGDTITVSGSSRNGESESVNGLSTIYLSGFGDLSPGALKYAYVTFKVNYDAAGRIKLDQDLYSGALTGGKRNIAEVNSYSTAEGIVDVDSNPGNLMSPDFNGEDIDYSKVEDDTDQAPNFQLIILGEDEYIRRFKGYVFEDERNVSNDATKKAHIGDGIDNNETKVNGVTVELVELLAQVNGEGIFTGNFLGEKTWASLTYPDFNSAPIVDTSRYFSGSGLMKIIINGPGITAVGNESLGEGEYGFKSIPAGVWFIRFKYGDTTQSVLLTDAAATTNTAKLSATTDYSEPLQSVNDLLKTGFNRDDAKGLMATSGLNEKSYNGQDFKSTIYQPGLSQATEYYGIKGYQNYETQNYTDAAGKINNGRDKSSMYYYHIGVGNTSPIVNDAKDVEARRLEVNAYSKGINNDLESGGQSVLNRRAEVLDSFERVLTHTPEDTDLAARQQEALIEMMANTYMTAQTGAINAELEIERQEIDGIYDDISYNVPNILLGLVERPRSQLIIAKKVANFKLVLANNQVLFNAAQAVNDLIFTPHSEHQPEEPAYTANKRLSGVILAHKGKISPELVQAALDDELMEGSRVDVTYKFTVRNTGEVDYVDRKFYYMGVEDHPAINIVKTSANGVIDYVSNMIKYDRNYQEDTEWSLRGPEYLIGSINGSDVNLDYVNSKYYDLIKDYNAILTTNKLGKELVPEKFEYADSTEQSSVDTSLILSSLISVNNGANNLVYNNLTEIISYANSVGRRMQYSVVGNQPMADQTERTDLSEDYVTLTTRVIPEEVDADSAQRIVLMPPTGFDKDYAPVIAAIIAALGIVGIAAFEIKRLLK